MLERERLDETISCQSRLVLVTKLGLNKELKLADQFIFFLFLTFGKKVLPCQLRQLSHPRHLNGVSPLGFSKLGPD